MALRKIFVVGDSISIGYGPFLKQMVSGVFDYDRKSGEEAALKNLDLPVGANGGDSTRVAAYLAALKSTGGVGSDFLLVNCGLHDIKTDKETGRKQVPPDAYRANLGKIVELASDMGAQLIWIHTTPVNEVDHNTVKPFYRYNADVNAYNATAEDVMRTAGVPICDLWRFQCNLDAGLLPDGVHFDADTQAKQAAFIAGFMSRFRLSD